MPSNQVTLKDIALKAGISTNAVSKALRDCSDISEATKERVRAIALDMGYVLDKTAANLRNGKSKNIALVYNDFYNPYFTVCCEKVFHKIKERGYQCNLIYSDAALMTMDDIENILINKFCGVISFVEPTTEVSSFFKKRGVPFILVGIHSNTPDIDCVYTDDIMGGRLVGEYFVKNEFNKAIYISNSSSETSYRRFLGFSNAINESGKDFEFIPFQQEDNILELAYNKIKADKIDFAFCFSDSLAIELKKYLKKKKNHERVTIFGYDCLHKYYYLVDKLNSVESNLVEILEFAIDTIIQRIKDELDPNIYINKIFPVSLFLK